MTQAFHVAVPITSSRQIIDEQISSIQPCDDLGVTQLREALDWVRGGAPLFRIQKPDVPNKHLVSYFVVMDVNERKILLVDHKKAMLWLPTGGHVEVDEDPRDTVSRECAEELGISARFIFDVPIFLTQTVTVGLTAGHTDVSLWYLVHGDSHQTYDFDVNEFNEIKWFDIDDIPFENSDPHMRRFIEKLQTILWNNS